MLLTRKAVRLAEAEARGGADPRRRARRGDAALLEYARKFDGLGAQAVRVPEATLPRRWLPQFRARRRDRGEKHSRLRRRCSFRARLDRDCADGRSLGQIVRPLESMGAYIPAGRYPLPSTLLMTVIPAQVAGVATICVASPQPSPEILGTAQWLGVTHVFRMGGAQAIAAMAFGTETVPQASIASWAPATSMSPPRRN